MRTMNAVRAAKLPKSKEEGTDVGEKKHTNNCNIEKEEI